MTARWRVRQRDGAWSRLALLFILLAGLGLRLYKLGADSLWYDETVSVHLAGSPLPELIRHTAGDIHPPGYYLLLRGWLLLTGYGNGHADPADPGLEFSAAFFSLFFGVLLIALVYAFARRAAGRSTALVAAALVALSPYNVWYGQEVRMYTLGAVLGVAAAWAMIEAVYTGQRNAYIVYALAAASGIYTLYYFAFLLIPLNLWALAAVFVRKRRPWPILLANGLAAVLYAPWLGIAFRQAVNPPVPPWRTPPSLLLALRESALALSFGQSAPRWSWPALLVTLALFVLGAAALVGGRVRVGNRERTVTLVAPALPFHRSSGVGLILAALGPPLLILALSVATPLYHVRYLFTYSPAFYVVLAAGLVTLWRRQRAAALLATIAWVIVAGASLRAFWFDPLYRADDHRAAVRELQARWRPGDVVLVNAGWAYTALTTYWDGEISGRYRITGALPEPRNDAALVMVTTGHTDGNPGLGWGDLRSDFFPMPAQQARQQVADLFDRFPRVWHYRVYDTVNDPDGLIRALLPRHGQVIDERTYGGEAFLNVSAYVPRSGAAWEETAPGADFGGTRLRYTVLPETITAGETVYTALTWLPTEPISVTFATSLRLVGPDGEAWAQPPDEQPLGPAFPSTAWPPGVAQRQPLSLTVPAGTPQGEYRVVLVVYDARSGQPLTPQPVNGAQDAPPGLLLRRISVTRAAPSALQEAIATFGPLALLEASTPVTTISSGDAIPVELLWQAREAPREPLVVVVQLLDEQGRVQAALEAEPLDGRYGVQNWQEGEIVRDKHVLTTPADLAPGRYRLIVGLYRAADRARFTTQTGLLTHSDSWTIKEIGVR